MSSTRSQLQTIFELAKDDRTEYEADWRRWARLTVPSYYRDHDDTDRGDDPHRRRHIQHPAGTLAVRTLRAGMHSGMTSPARPWFKIMTPDPDLRERAGPKAYLENGERRLREIFLKSNVYNTLHDGYGHLAVIGNLAALLVRDPVTTVRLVPELAGRYWFLTDAHGRVDTLIRARYWTARQLVQSFGDRVPSKVRSSFDKGDYNEKFKVIHYVGPRRPEELDPERMDGKNKPFRSTYWCEESGASKDHLLQDSGFSYNPVLGVRWDTIIGEAYGFGPTADAYPTLRSLQVTKRGYDEMVDYARRPTLAVPSSMRNSRVAHTPGGIVYYDAATSNGRSPIYRVSADNPPLGPVMEGQQLDIELVNQAFYVDLFKMLENLQGVQPRNVMELAERKEEKLLQLGPVLDRLHNELYHPLIVNSWRFLEEDGELGPLPPELEGVPLRIEYLSMLAQAQRAVATASIDRMAAFVGNLSPVFQDVIDKFDADQAVDEYAEAIGSPARVIRADDEVAKLRETRIQAQQQAQAAEMASKMAPALKQGADAARVLSETDENSAGGRLLAQLGLGL